jgi:hypothetical protein
MVLKISDPIQRKRWETHIKAHNHMRPKQDTIDTITVMTLNNVPLKEIKRVSAGQSELINTVRMRLRRQGLA